MVVPPRYRLQLGRVELRYTLHTGSLSQAKARAKTIAAYVLDLFHQLGSSDSSPALLQLSIRDFVADQLASWADHSTNEGAPGITSLPSLSAPQVPPQAPNTSLVKTLLTKVIHEYATEKKNAGKWRTKTEQENLACYRLFLTWAGDGVMVEDITAKLMREYKAALQKLPANMEKSPQYRGKSIRELLQMADQAQIPTVMGIATINKNLNRMSTVLAYAVKNGYIPFNPAADMQVEQPRRDEELRDTFSQDDLYALFHSSQYTTDTFKHPYQFWTPLLALFTAARQNELAQLYLDDIRQEDGVWVFDINGKRPDQKLKNKNSARLIPIHDFLLELGLVRYAQELQARGSSRLFPELTHRRDGYGQDVSRWFNGNGTSPGYRQRCGVDAAPGQGKKDFHSFRHTTITLLVGKRVDINLLHKLDGHKLDSMTLDR
jgi:integrase